MKTPPALQKGDKILLIAPALFIEKEKLSFAIHILESWGYQVVLSDLLSEPYYQFAGTISQRIKALQEALDHPEIKAIICVRGGYGMGQLVDKLNYEKFSQNPKWIVGFSDITILLATLYKNGIKSIHGVMPILFEKNTEDSLLSLKRTLENKPFLYEYSSKSYYKRGRGTGVLIGGNLSILQTLIGTDSDFEPEDKILFIEEVGEPLYKIDRMLRHWHRAGKLSKLRGLIIGSFSKIKAENPPFDKSVIEIIRDLTLSEMYPIVFDFPTGHEEENLALVVGEEVELEVNAQKVKLKSAEQF